MEPFTCHTGVAAPLRRANIDTDQIVPKQFLKRTGREGFGEVLFFDWRYLPNGDPDPAFVLNEPAYRGATVLVAGSNFGCGSSREHAPWALAQYGFRAIVAPSFADIFRGNCLKNGLLPVELPEPIVAAILDRAEERSGYRLTVDLERQKVIDDRGIDEPFDIDAFRRGCLLRGMDDVALSEQHVEIVAQYEAHRPGWLPSVRPAA